MQEQAIVGTEVEKARGPKYFVNIEGEAHPWDSPTITTEVVELKPGQRFAKKIRFKRG